MTRNRPENGPLKEVGPVKGKDDTTALPGIVDSPDGFRQSLAVEQKRISKSIEGSIKDLQLVRADSEPDLPKSDGQAEATLAAGLGKPSSVSTEEGRTELHWKTEKGDRKLTRYSSGAEQLFDEKGRVVGQLETRDFLKFPESLTRDEIHFEYGHGTNENNIAKMVKKNTATGETTTVEVGKDRVASINALRDPNKPGYEIVTVPKQEGKKKDGEKGVSLPISNQETHFLEGGTTSVTQFKSERMQAVIQSSRVLFKEEPSPDGRSSLPTGTTIEQFETVRGKISDRSITATLPDSDNRSSCSYDQKGDESAKQTGETYRKPVSYKAQVSGKEHDFTGVTSWERLADGSIELSTNDQNKPSIILRADGKGGFKAIEMDR